MRIKSLLLVTALMLTGCYSAGPETRLVDPTGAHHIGDCNAVGSRAHDYSTLLMNSVNFIREREGLPAHSYNCTLKESAMFALNDFVSEDAEAADNYIDYFNVHVTKNSADHAWQNGYTGEVVDLVFSIPDQLPPAMVDAWIYKQLPALYSEKPLNIGLADMRIGDHRIIAVHFGEQISNND